MTSARPGRSRVVPSLVSAAGTPELESGDREVLVEAQDMPAAPRLHHREADGVGIRDRVGRESFQPTPCRPVVLGICEVNRDAWTRLDAVQRTPGELDAGPEERQTMDFGEDEVGGEEWNVLLERLAEETVRREMVLVAPSPQGDPGAAIDEQANGSVVDAPGRVSSSRQRRSR